MSRSILNLGPPALGQFPFIDVMRSIALFTNTSSTPPTDLNANQYPFGTTTNTIQCNPLPINSHYTGEWVVDWVGDVGSAGPQLATGTTVTSGASFVVPGTTINTTFKGNNGRVEFIITNPADSFTFNFLAGTYTGFTSFRFYRKDQESLLNAGEIFNPELIDQINEINPRALRFLDWSNANGRICQKYADLTPDTNLSWVSGTWNPNDYVGTIAGTNTFTCSDGPGHNPLAYVDGEVIQGMVTNASTGACTLNRSSLGAKPILTALAQAAGSGNVLSGRNTFHYSAFFDAFLCDQNSRSIASNVPLSVMVALCNRTQRSFWISYNLLMFDDAWQQVVTYVRDNLDPGLEFIFDIGNETWNFAFPQFWVARNAGKLLGWQESSNEDVLSYQGLRNRQVAELAMDSWSPRSSAELIPITLFQFAGDTTIVNFQFNGASLRFTKTVTPTLTIASPCVMSGSSCGNGNTVVFNNNGDTLPTGLSFATTYYMVNTNTTNSTCQLSLTDGGAAINTSGTQSGTHNATVTNLLYENFAGAEYYQVGNRPIDYAGAMAYATYYNGAQWQDLEIADSRYLARDTAVGGSTLRFNISNITQANPAVVTTTAAHGYSNGNRIKIESVSGMTEVNNNYYTSANVTSTTFELQNTDSTGFTAYSSGGNTSRLRSNDVVFSALDAWLANNTASAFSILDGDFRNGTRTYINLGVFGAWTNPQTVDQMNTDDGVSYNYFFWEPYRALYNKPLLCYEGGFQVTPPGVDTLLKMGAGVVTYSATFDVSNDTVTLSGKDLINGDGLMFPSGTLPGGLTTTTQCFVVQASGGIGKLSTTHNGSPINLTGSPGTCVANYTPYAGPALDLLYAYKLDDMFTQLVFDQFTDQVDVYSGTSPAWYYFCYPFNAFSPWTTHGDPTTKYGGDIYEDKFNSYYGMAEFNGSVVPPTPTPEGPPSGFPYLNQTTTMSLRHRNFPVPVGYPQASVYGHRNSQRLGSTFVSGNRSAHRIGAGTSTPPSRPKPANRKR